MSEQSEMFTITKYQGTLCVPFVQTWSKNAESVSSYSHQHESCWCLLFPATTATAQKYKTACPVEEISSLHLQF